MSTLEERNAAADTIWTATSPTKMIVESQCLIPVLYPTGSYTDAYNGLILLLTVDAGP